MKTKIILSTLLMVFLLQGSGFSQIKIGYTNIELILAYMPEAKQVEQTLQTYQKKLGEQIQIKENYAKSKLQEYLEKKENGTLSKEAEQAAQIELQKLDQEIGTEAQKSENKLLAKREELLVPVLEKLQDAIDDVAEANGYSYVLNQTTSTGVSTILFGPEEDDLTEKILKKMGVTIPQQNK